MLLRTAKLWSGSSALLREKPIDYQRRADDVRCFVGKCYLDLQQDILVAVAKIQIRGNRDGGGSWRNVERCDEMKMKYSKIYFQRILETKGFFPSCLLCSLVLTNRGR